MYQVDLATAQLLLKFLFCQKMVYNYGHWRVRGRPLCSWPSGGDVGEAAAEVILEMDVAVHEGEAEEIPAPRVTVPKKPDRNMQ